MEGNKNNRQVCISDKNQHWQSCIDGVRDAIKQERPEIITENELWDVQKKRGTSGVLKFLIRLGHEVFVKKTMEIVRKTEL